MADRRVRYILEVDYEGESVVVRAADDLRQVDDAAREAGEGLKQTGDGFSKLQANIVTAQSALGVVEQGLQTVQAAAQLAWDTLSEGSALADARGDFADLAAEIGTTADAMQGELMAAAGGLKTSAELIGESSELMGLGLGLTKEQIVDLSRVAAELELDMGALGDAINTGSSRALKEFGFNVGDVKARVAELREEGRSLNEAMAMAMIEAGEEKIARVGKRSEESAGQLEILQNVVEEVQNEFARGAAEGFADSLAKIGSTAPAAGASMAAMAYGAASFATSSLPAMEEGMRRVNDAMGMGWITTMWDAVLVGAILRGTMEGAVTPLEAYGRMQEEAAIAVVKAATGQEELAEATWGSALVAEYAEGAWAGVIETQRVWAAQAAFAVESGRGMRDSMEAMNQEAANQEVTFDLAGRAAQAWGEYVDEVTARSGDYFAQITSSGRAQYDLNDAMYAAADAYGAGAVALGEIGVETGQFKQNVADAGVAAAQQQVIVDNLAGAARAGAIEWEDYTETVERALRIASGQEYLIDLGAREMPEMEDRGFREGYQEDQEADTREISPYAVVLQADNQAVLDAVEEARGVVEGFVSPEEVYEAVVDLNIEAVVDKGKIVQGIIDGLPTGKTIKVDIEVTGGELLEQLIAGGWSPGR